MDTVKAKDMKFDPNFPESMTRANPPIMWRVMIRHLASVVGWEGASAIVLWMIHHSVSDSKHYFLTWSTGNPGIILCMCPANERWGYNVMSSLIGWVHSHNDPCNLTTMEYVFIPYDGSSWWLQMAWHQCQAISNHHGDLIMCCHHCHHRNLYHLYYCQERDCHLHNHNTFWTHLLKS